MLVTCPECGKSISSQADPCPHCGYPWAGLRSKENSELLLKELQKTIFEKRPEKKDFVAYGDLIRKCKKDRNHPDIIPKFNIKKRDGTGFFIEAKYTCLVCGESWIMFLIPHKEHGMFVG